MLHVSVHGPARLPKIRQRGRKSDTFEHNSQKYTVIDSSEAPYSPSRHVSLVSSPCFHLVEAGVGEREQNMLVLFRALHPLWSSAGESTPQLAPSPTQTLRPHLMHFQTDLNL